MYLHRDVKPSNCFVDADGTVKVGDFGLSISTLARDVSQLTMTGAFLGTPQFAAPEQLRGDPLDVRADIYGVGATLYYLLTGQPPFDDTDVLALVTRIATEAPRSPRALVPSLPRGLAAIILRCLARDRAQRPASYAALSDALRPFSSAAGLPPPIGLRVLAGIIDLMSWTLTFSLLVLGVSWNTAWEPRPWLSLLHLVGDGYRLLRDLRRRMGRVDRQTTGRVTCGAGPSSRPAGVSRAAGRSLIFETPTLWSVRRSGCSWRSRGCPSASAALIFGSCRRCCSQPPDAATGSLPPTISGPERASSTGSRRLGAQSSFRRQSPPSAPPPRRGAWVPST